MRVGRVAQPDEHAIEELLDQDRIVNLFLLAFLAQVPMDQVYWYAAIDQDRALGVALVLAGHIMVPYAPDPIVARRLGDALHGVHTPCMCVGPRADVDAIWARWAPGSRPTRRLDQRLYVCERVADDAPSGAVRPARLGERDLLARWAREMEIEDLGRDPAAPDPEAHARVVTTRIEQGRTWVMDEDGAPCFAVGVGAATRDGVQVGGTFVPPERRGHGVATRGMVGLTAALLRAHAAVTLHVNEQNIAAVRCYERVGFQRRDPFRLITVEPPAAGQ